MSPELLRKSRSAFTSLVTIPGPPVALPGTESRLACRTGVDSKCEPNRVTGSRNEASRQSFWPLSDLRWIIQIR